METPTPQHVRVTHQREQQIIVLDFPTGRITGQAVREMYEQVAALFDLRPLRLLVDLNRVDLVSSGAMGMLVTLQKKMYQFGGQMRIAAPDRNVLGQFQVLNLHLVLSLHESVETAKAAMK